MAARKTPAAKTGAAPRKVSAKKKTTAKASAAKTGAAAKARDIRTWARTAARPEVKAHKARLPQVDFRAQAVIDATGSNTAAAKLLAVSKSQTSRWSRGEEHPGPDKARLLLDVDYVYSRAQLIWGGDAVNAWMLGSNMLLDGARPIDVVRERGPADVIAALDAEASGTFA